jgi:hypothetical protein
VLILLLVPLALATRWSFSDESGLGAEFHPRPDALEYAASAQALKDGGRFYLQVGPEQVRPRYAPGWPLLLSLPLRLGYPPQELWRLTGLFGAAISIVLAELVAFVTITRRRSRPGEDGHAWRAVAAGAFAGCLWALLPTAVFRGGQVMTDEPAVLLQGLALIGVVLGLREGSRHARTLLVCAGLCLGLLATLRLVAAVLVSLALGVLLLDALRRGGVSATARSAAAITAGALPPILATVWILVSGGLAPWPWDAYAFWAPDRYAEFSSTFHLRHALEGVPRFTMPFGEQRGHWQHSLFLMLGLPGLVARQSAGVGWLLVAWGYGLFQLFRCKQAEVRVLGIALAGLVAGTNLVFVLYFYPDTRFYLGPLAIAVGLAGLAVGHGSTEPTPWPRTLALCFALASTASVGHELHGHWLEMWKPPRGTNARTIAAAEAWLALDDAERARSEMGFDTVRAQALGLLPYDRALQIKEWGRLQPTEHVGRLQRFHGLLKDE